jgi:hypothetical protein
MTGTGTYEQSRSEGGRARFLVARARAFADLPISEETDELVGKFDQFGCFIIHPITLQIARDYTKDLDKKPPLGLLMFSHGYEIEDILKEYYDKGRTVPKHLGQILNLVASSCVRAYGEYSEVPHEIQGVMCFKSERVTFQLSRTLRVRADVVIEAGLKCRLVTAAHAGFAHLSQLPASYMRAYLSQDPFHRVGFEEADKLWEVLKRYRKRHFPGDLE